MASERPAAGAIISECGVYRYQLWRTWSDAPAGVFIMLNPSTADAAKDDPTIRRVVQFGRDFGWGGVVVVNLFAFRATDPMSMLKAADPVGPENDEAIQYALMASPAGVVCGWGRGNGKVRVAERAFAVRCMAAKLGVPLTALKFASEGAPCHPLYIPAAARPLPYPHPGA